MAEDKGNDVRSRYVQEGKLVRSQVLKEANLVIKAYVDSQEFKQAVEAGRFSVFDEIEQRLAEDMRRISSEVPRLMSVISGWRGDLDELLENLKRHNLHDRATIIAGLIGQLNTFEARASMAWSTMQAFDKEVLANAVFLSGGIQTDAGKQKLLEGLKGIITASESWAIVDKQVETVVDKLHKNVIDANDEFRRLSTKLNNYWGAGFDLDGLIHGTGMFRDRPNIADRYKIIVRRIQTKPNEFKTDQKTMDKLNEFFRTYIKSQRYVNVQGHEGDPWLLPEEVEPTKTDLQYYDKAVSALKQRGYERHPYPWEMFTIIFDYLENPLSIYHDLGQDMLRGHGEWTALSFMKQGNTLNMAENTTNLRWNGVDHELKGKQPDGRILESLPNFPEQVREWVKVEQLPVSFVQMMWGKTRGELEQYNAGSYILTDNVWRPVARGDEDSDFNLDAFSIRGASRGVHRK